jgi:FkbM family methyltransferase
MKKRITNTQKYKNFISWDSRYKGAFDSEEYTVYDFFYNNIFKNKDDGFIIDIGANDGVTISHSLPFIDKGWSALMIEPNPVLFKKMKDLYSDLSDVICVNLAVAEKQIEKTELYLGCEKHQGHSTILFSETTAEEVQEFFSNEKIFVSCDTLENIIIKNNINKEIDILHIDAEGKTIDILRSFNFKKYRPKFISVDILTQDFDPRRNQLKELMQQIN